MTITPKEGMNILRRRRLTLGLKPTIYYLTENDKADFDRAYSQSESAAIELKRKSKEEG